jgi:hypothetical protein
MRIILPAMMLAMSSFTAQAGVSQCTTINGEEHCETGDHSLNCQTINGKTTCIKDGVIQHSETTTTKDGKTQHSESTKTSPGSSAVDADKAMAAAGVKIGPGGRVRVKTPSANVDVGGDDKDDDKE